ncbi:MAG: zeta toxin family protein [Candidatus Aenigmarchaeota archaeon]|nr:zeta toxin family protein [Candidatus Aenigmarchaeota archaeon]
MSLEIPPVFKSKLFVSILIIKVVSSFVFGSDFIVNGFLPFVKYFVESGFSDPYQHFVNIGHLKAFPYPTVMLAVLTVPYALISLISSFWTSDAFLNLFVIRIPVLITDLFIFYVLIKWLKTREDKILKYYWASPILFYISYFHGQLDVIPIAILFISMVFLFRNKLFLSALVLGAGIATKTNILLTLPFTAIFLWKNKSLKSALIFGLVTTVTYIILLTPFISSSGFVQMVFGASEQFRVFDMIVPLGFSNILLLAAPAAYLILLFNFSSYERVNKDVLMMMLALVFTVVVTLVPPAQGWYYWTVPFLIYFFVKQEKVPMLSFWAINLFYLGYFIFNQNSDFFQSFQLIAPQIANMPSTYQMIESLGVNPMLVSNMLFTGLTASLAMTALWTYTIGVKSNLEYKTKDRPTIIGIGGDSGAGKSTSAELIADIFSKRNTLIVNGDDMHKWERGNENWQVFTHLNPEANKLHQELDQAVAMSEWNKVTRVMYDHKTGKFTEPVEIGPNNFIIFEGLHPFYLKRMRDLYDVKVYTQPSEELKLHWKVLRDTKERGHTRRQIIQQIRKRKFDKAKFIDPQKQFADVVVSYFSRKRIDKIGSSKAKVDMGLKIWLDNSIDMVPLENVLSTAKTLKFVNYNEDDLKTQCCEFYGTITENELERSLHILVPNFENLIHNPSPKFRKDYDGIYQLFFIYYLSEISKFKGR